MLALYHPIPQNAIFKVKDDWTKAMTDFGKEISQWLLGTFHPCSTMKCSDTHEMCYDENEKKRFQMGKNSLLVIFANLEWAPILWRRGVDRLVSFWPCFQWESSIPTAPKYYYQGKVQFWWYWISKMYQSSLEHKIFQYLKQVGTAHSAHMATSGVFFGKGKSERC